MASNPKPKYHAPARHTRAHTTKPVLAQIGEVSQSTEGTTVAVVRLDPSVFARFRDAVAALNDE